MEFRHLEYFVVVAEELSFTRAATRLRMAQPPLSQQIAKLERELHTHLFERATRGLRLTAAGEVLLPQAREILTRRREACRLTRHTGKGASGIVRIGCVSSGFTGVLRELVALLRDRHSELVPLVYEMEVTPQLEALASGGLDAGLMRIHSAPLDLRLLPLREEALVAALPDTHPLASADPVPLAELAGQKFVIFPRASATDAFDTIASCCLASGFSPDVIYEASNDASLLGIVGCGLAVSIVPAATTNLTVPGVVYRSLAGASGATSTISLVVASSAALRLLAVAEEMTTVGKREPGPASAEKTDAAGQTAADERGTATPC